METVSAGPDAKKARWSPTSQDAFANYGYGPNASINQQQQQQQLYSTGAPSLSINTNTGAVNGQQLSPNAFAQQQQQPSPSAASPYANFGAYNMLGLGLPAMNMLGFPYNGQMGSFNQVRCPNPTVPA